MGGSRAESFSDQKDKPPEKTETAPCSSTELLLSRRPQPDQSKAETENLVSGGALPSLLVGRDRTDPYTALEVDACAKSRTKLVARKLESGGVDQGDKSTKEQPASVERTSAAHDHLIRSLNEHGCLPKGLERSELERLKGERDALGQNLDRLSVDTKNLNQTINDTAVARSLADLKEQQGYIQKDLDLNLIANSKRLDRKVAEDLFHAGINSDNLFANTKEVNVSDPKIFEKIQSALDAKKDLDPKVRSDLEDAATNLRLIHTAYPEGGSSERLSIALATSLENAGIRLPDGAYRTNYSNPLLNVNDKDVFRKCQDEIEANKNLTPEQRNHLKAELAEFREAHQLVTDQQEKVGSLQKQIDEKQSQVNIMQEPLLKKYAEISKTQLIFNQTQEEIREGSFEDDLKEIGKLHSEKQEQIFSSLEMIAKDTGGPPNHLTPAQKTELIREIARQIAHPDEIKQGNKETCGLGSTEFELATKHPEKYAKYIAGLATRGEAKVHSGSLRIHKDLINSDGIALDDGDGDRTLASKIFQTAAAERLLSDQAKDKGQPAPEYRDEKGKFRISTSEDTANAKQTSGESIVDKKGNSRDWAGTDPEYLAKLTTELTGDSYQTRAIKVAQPQGESEWKLAEKEFVDALKGQEMPVKVNLLLRKDDFTGMNSTDKHEVSITKLEQNSAGETMVYYHNTARGTDHNFPNGKPVPLRDFVKAMQHPDDYTGRLILKK